LFINFVIQIFGSLQLILQLVTNIPIFLLQVFKVVV
jgi:hypothetical protein